jgi:dUTP pyrophosphatase
VKIQVTLLRLDRELPLPEHAHPGDAGLDLYARTACKLAPGERAVVPTGIAVAIPSGYGGLVLARSGHARRHGIGVVNGPGLIDSGYRGEIAVILINHGIETVAFKRGDRIAQLVVLPVPEVEWKEVAELPDTERGHGGFGSSGA